MDKQYWKEIAAEFIKQDITQIQVNEDFQLKCIQVNYYINLLSQISHSLVVILELSGVSEVQYKEIMMRVVSTRIIDVVKSEVQFSDTEVYIQKVHAQAVAIT